MCMWFKYTWYFCPPACLSHDLLEVFPNLRGVHLSDELLDEVLVHVLSHLMHPLGQRSRGVLLDPKMPDQDPYSEDSRSTQSEQQHLLQHGGVLSQLLQRLRRTPWSRATLQLVRCCKTVTYGTFGYGLALKVWPFSEKRAGGLTPRWSEAKIRRIFWDHKVYWLIYWIRFLACGRLSWTLFL